MKPCHVLIADDHSLVAEGIRKLLEQECEIVGIVPNWRLLLAEAERLKPEVILLDIAMPEMNGIDAGKRLRQILPEVKLVFVTQQIERNYVQAAFNAGANAYVVKQSAFADLHQALQSVLHGRYYVSPCIALDLPPISELRRAPSPFFSAGITPRQREVLQLVAEGKTLKDVANALNISVKTVEFHKRSIMDALRLRTTAELTKYALEHGIIAFTR
jgi:DNA-binding NarL/FixJ family response regulator